MNQNRFMYEVASRLLVFGFAYLVLAMVFIIGGVTAADMLFWLNVRSRSQSFHAVNIIVSAAMIASGLALYIFKPRITLKNGTHLSGSMKLRLHVGVRLMVYGAALLAIMFLLALVGVDLKKVFFGIDVIETKLFLIPIAMLIAGAAIVFWPLKKK